MSDQIVKTVHYVNVTVDGYDAAFWNGSYTMLRNAIEEHLGQFLHDDDVAEEAIFCETIERLGRVLRDVKRDEESGDYVGPVHLEDFWRTK